MENQTQLSESYQETRNKEYQRRAHSVGISIWHFEWVTKYRYKMMRKEEYSRLMIGCIRNVAYRHKLKIIILEVLPEHVHCEVELPLSMSPSEALQLLKGGSSFLFFKHHEKAVLRYPKRHLWSTGKFAASVGFVQQDVVTEYIRTQKEHHGLK
jgi:putative transposase